MTMFEVVERHRYDGSNWSAEAWDWTFPSVDEAYAEICEHIRRKQGYAQVERGYWTVNLGDDHLFQILEVQ